MQFANIVKIPCTSQNLVPFASIDLAFISPKLSLK